MVNVPATIFATGYYEFLMRDSLQKIQGGHAEHEAGDEGLSKHLSRVTGQDVGGNSIDERMTERGFMNAANGVETTNGVHHKQF